MYDFKVNSPVVFVSGTSLGSLENRQVTRVLPLLSQVVLISHVNMSAPVHSHSQDQNETLHRSASQKKC